MNTIDATEEKNNWTYIYLYIYISVLKKIKINPFFFNAFKSLFKKDSDEQSCHGIEVARTVIVLLGRRMSIAVYMRIIRRLKCNDFDETLTPVVH